jgi:hypothetical protein
VEVGYLRTYFAFFSSKLHSVASLSLILTTCNSWRNSPLLRDSNKKKHFILRQKYNVDILKSFFFLVHFCLLSLLGSTFSMYMSVLSSWSSKMKNTYNKDVRLVLLHWLPQKQAQKSLQVMFCKEEKEMIAIRAPSTFLLSTVSLCVNMWFVCYTERSWNASLSLFPLHTLYTIRIFGCSACPWEVEKTRSALSSIYMLPAGNPSLVILNFQPPVGCTPAPTLSTSQTDWMKRA